MPARRLSISGRVQNVGYRDWMVAQARTLGLSGWVRNNRMEGTVEALVDGEAGAIAELLRACRRGPALAAVTGIVEELADPPSEPGFRRMPSV
jgi:acylphosphatase